MTKGFRVTRINAREHRIEITSWPLHPRSLVRMSRGMRRRRHGYSNPVPHAHSYRHRFVRNRRRRS